MDALAPALVGLGLFLMYEAYKNTNPTPLATIKTNVTANGTTKIGGLSQAGATAAQGF